MLYNQSEADTQSTKLRFRTAYLDRTLHSNKSTVEQQLYDPNNWHKINTNTTQITYTTLCAKTTHEYLPNPDVTVSHNELYAASWEMDFGKQIDEHTTSDDTNNEQITTQETTHTDEAEMTNEVARQQTEDHG